MPFIYVDPMLIEQAFAQVVNNAAKYSPAGSTITVAAKRNGHGLVLSVKRSRLGLTEDESAQVGDRFFRGARHAASRPAPGSASWIAKAFVTANGGRLEAVSAGVNLGTTIAIKLPMAPNAPNRRPIPMAEPAPVVLVVDDEVQIRRFLRAGLELDGFVVQDAETGSDAMRAVTLTPPDLVILDLGLPDMDGGADVLGRLRAWSSVHLIVLSVRSNEAEKVRLLGIGADDYVVKPFGMAELLACAHAAMRRQVRATSGEPVVRAGPLLIDLAARFVTINGERVVLTPKEYRLRRRSWRSTPATW